MARRLMSLVLRGSSPEVFQPGDWNPWVHYPGGGVEQRILLWLAEDEFRSLVEIYTDRLAIVRYVPGKVVPIQKLACPECVTCPWVSETGGCLAPENVVGFPAFMANALDTCPMRKPLEE